MKDTGLIAELDATVGNLREAKWSELGVGYIAIGLMLVQRLDRIASNLQETARVLGNRLPGK